MEIEKKYLVNKSKLDKIINPTKESSNESPYFLGHSIANMEQIYLNDINDEWLIRLRMESTNDPTRHGDYCTLTLKSKGLLSREEFEFQIPRRSYDPIVKYAKSKIKKTRYNIQYQISKAISYLLEIDVYDDYDFVICEVEFDSVKEAEIFDANYRPEWCFKDITNVPEYKNVNLAIPINHDKKES